MNRILPPSLPPLSLALSLLALGPGLAPAAPAPDPPGAAPRVETVDVCVYAATPGGILAAVAARRAGLSTLIVEPGRWVGGMLGAGLKPMQDCPNYAATGGLTRELLRTLGDPEWDGDLLKRGALSRVSPVAVQRDFRRLLERHAIPVIHDHRVASCERRDATIASALFDLAPFDPLGCPVPRAVAPGALRVRAKIYIDAGYEGDLMAQAGVSWRVGREASAEYDEESAGVQPPMEVAPIDPFVIPGKPESGLLKWVENDPGKPVGAADETTQAYNYRYYTTDDPAHRLPITPPAGYDPRDFELVGRYVRHLAESTPDESALLRRLTGVFPGWMNSGEWNYQRESLFSMAPVGVSHLYARGGYEEKARVWKLHQDYLRGLHAFLSADPRVPEAFRRRTAAIGLDARVHPDTGGWPHQLYIRVARRMIGAAIITAHDVYNRTRIDDPIGLAQYGIDTYPARRIWFVRDGKPRVGIEGKMFVGGSRGPTDVPYPIPYRAITPREGECRNLLVPVCFSASHLGYASARMEPVFMICGESAGIAARHAIAEGVAVQRIDPAKFRAALERAGQKLVWDAPPRTAPAPRDPGSARRPFAFESLLEQCDSDGNGAVNRSEWEIGKPGWEWLFPTIDTDGDGRIGAPEYDAFQKFKASHPDWAKQSRAR